MADSISTVSYLGIQDYPGYRVGDDGSVWTRKMRGSRDGSLTNDWRRLKAYTDRRGAQHVTLCNGTKPKTRTVHSLVMFAFIGPRPSGMDICHNDGNPANNTVDNLRWDTRKGNMADMIRHDRSTRGERHRLAVLTELQVIDIKRRSNSGAVGRMLAKEYGVSYAQISRIKNGIRWPHVLTEGNA